jgi:hypothetical protein
MKNVIEHAALLQCSVISLKWHLIGAKFQGQDLTGHSKEVAEVAVAEESENTNQSTMYMYRKCLH